jgi:hypothetical protein
MPQWRAMETAPKDRPIAILSVQHQDCGGVYVTLDICQWRGESFVLGYGLDTNIGHGCATAWCEVIELELEGIIETTRGTYG